MTSRGKIIGVHPSITNILNTLQRISRSSCTVLVTGESGTGKELVVAALHDLSLRSNMPLVTVNCGAIPENLIESELFGHVKGAFTGAHATRHGHVAAAEGGTLFLDEIGELPLSLQVKILRLLQQREYSPVGDSQVTKCDVRIAAATNRNLEEEVKRGRFREDLFYRLNVVNLHLPALRERPGDVALLAFHFFEIFIAKSGRQDLEGFSEEALAALTNHSWPGNIRALENAIERAVLLSAGPLIEAIDLPAPIRTTPDSGTYMKVESAPLPGQGIDLREAVGTYENALIKQALERTGYNKNQAARLLNINRTTLVEMMKRKGL